MKRIVVDELEENLGCVRCLIYSIIQLFYAYLLFLDVAWADG